MRTKLYTLTDKQYNLLARMDKTFDHNWPVLFDVVMRARTYDSFEQKIFNMIRTHYIKYIQIHGSTIPKTKTNIYIIAEPR